MNLFQSVELALKEYTNRRRKKLQLMHLALQLTAFRQSEKDSEMQMDAQAIDCIIYGGAVAENTDVIVNFLPRERKLLLPLIADNSSW